MMTNDSAGETTRTAGPMVVAAFHNYLSVRRSAAPLTLETYSRQIRKFEKFIAGKALTEVERPDVIDFLQYQRAAGLKGIG